MLEPSTLTQRDSELMRTQGTEVKADGAGADSMSALFGIFGSIKPQQAGLSRDALPQIDDEEIQKEVQLKLMRHRQKRMRHMQARES